MTSTEWLIEQVKSKEWQDMFIWHKEEVFNQALQMENNQIINTEWVFQFDNDEPIPLQGYNLDEKKLIIEIKNTSNIHFTDGKGKNLKIFAIEKKVIMRIDDINAMADVDIKENERLEKLAEEVYGKGVKEDYEEGFVDGFNKAKETLYSEEEVLKLLLRLQQTESYDNLYDWFKQFKKQ